MTKTYAQLSREIASLQAAAEKLRAAEIKAAVAKANELISAYGLTANDLKFSSSTSSPSVGKSVRAVASDARYSDGEGNTWGGRGPRPAWLKNALAKGQSIESFETGRSSVPSTSKRSLGTKSGFKVAIKYRDAATGMSWSGRGSQPSWLKAALKKRGSKITDFLVNAQPSNMEPPAMDSGSVNRTAKPGAKKVLGSHALKTSGSPALPRKSAAAKSSLKSGGLKKSMAGKPVTKAVKPDARLVAKSAGKSRSRKQASSSGQADSTNGAAADRLTTQGGADLAT